MGLAEKFIIALTLTRACDKLKASAICHTKTINNLSLNYLWHNLLWQMGSSFLNVDT